MIVSRRYQFALLTAVVIHLLAFVALIYAGWVKEKRSLQGPRNGSLVQVSMIDPKPQPKPRETKPKSNNNNPKPTPKVTPRQTKKATPKPTKKVTPKPTKKKEKKKTPKPTPKATKKAPSTPVPTQKKLKTPAPTKKPVKTPDKKNKALSPEDQKRLYENKDRRMIDTSKSKFIEPSTNQVDHGSTSLRGAGLPEYYAKAALDKLAKFFQVPPDKQKEITSVISCRIDKNGTITNVRVQRSCGIDELNQIAMDALKNTRRFNPFPDGFKEKYVDVEISFTFKQ